jgi:hypothetical protein
MGDLMGEKQATFMGFRPQLPRPEYDIATHGVGSGIDGSGGFGSLSAGVDADGAEVVTEAGFEEGPYGRIERPARAKAVQEIIGNGVTGHACKASGFSLHASFLFLIFLTDRAGGATFGAARTGWLDHRCRHPHHLFGDTVCFLLISVSRLIDH